jgi:alanine dehydrogenase
MRVGLPRMHREAGEKRDFLPSFVAALQAAGATQIVAERGYGSGMGVPETEYLAGADRLVFGTLDDCLAQECIMQVRCLDERFFDRLRPGTLLVSMMHYSTRPQRVRKLADRGIRAIGLDGLLDDGGRRLVENLADVAGNGVAAAFVELARLYPGFDDPHRPPLRVTVLGSGAVGSHAVRAASVYGDRDLRDAMVARGVMGVEVRVVDHDLTRHESYMCGLLSTTDLLVDATQRPDATKHVIPNRWVGIMPAHAVLLDLSVDPYDFSVTPPIVKGIEGIPQGNLDEFVFRADDPVYAQLDGRVSTDHRRVALSCYSWPGRNPRACMEIYGSQLEPFLEVMLNKPADRWEKHGDSLYERALARAELSRWLETTAA